MTKTEISGSTRYHKRENREKLPLLLMLLPFLILFIAFTVIPIISSVVLSFFNYDMVHQLEFAGLGNYITMLLEDEVFWICVKNTVLFAIITGPIGFLLSFVLAWMINELGRGMRTLLSFLFYSPALMGNVYFIWQVLFSCVMQIQSAFSVSGIASTLCGYPSVNYCADTLVTLLTDIGGTRYEMGLAAAMSVFLFAIMAFTRVVIGKAVTSLGK